MHRDRSDSDQRPVLVIGSTGKTGRRVLERLRSRDLPTREGSRNSPIPFDWEDPETWTAALNGTRAAYVSFFPDLAVPGAPDTIGEFTRRAEEAGVEQLVLLSGRGEPEARRCEQIVEASGLRWTVVRASWFAQNFSEGFLCDFVVSGTVALPTGGVREPFVDVEDIADVAARALTTRDLDDRLIEVTGPRSMTFAEAVAEVGEAAGREIRFHEIAHEDFLDSVRAAGVPEDFVSLLDYLFRVVLDGRNESVSDGVRSALGREPRDFREYAREVASTGVWSAAARAV